MSQSSSNSECDNELREVVEGSKATVGGGGGGGGRVVGVGGEQSGCGWMDLWLRIRARSSEQTFGDDLRSQRKL